MGWPYQNILTGRTRSTH